MTAFLNYELFFRKDIDGPLILTSPNEVDLHHKNAITFKVGAGMYYLPNEFLTSIEESKILVKNIGWGSNFRDMASSYEAVLIEYDINP